MNDDRGPLTDGEPPVGDDMQRMLVRMRQDVVGRMAAAPRPRRNRRRAGIAIGVVALIGLVSAGGSVALGLVPQPFAAAPTPAPSSAVPAPQPSRSPSSARFTPSPATPAPTPRQTPGSGSSTSAGQVPASCTALVPAADRERFFGAMTLQEFVVQDEQEARSPTPEERQLGHLGAGQELECSWQADGVASRLAISVGPLRDYSAADARNAALGSGGTCDQQLGGEVCQHAFTAQADTVPTTETTLIREGLSVQIQQTDWPTDGLLSTVVGQVWGD